MKGTEKLIAHIRYDAAKQADEILARAEKDCAILRLELEQKARAAYTEKIREGVQYEKQRFESMERFAVIEEKKALLSQRQALIDECFRLAESKICALPKEDYLKWLCSLVEDTGETKGEILLNAGDRADFGSSLIKALGQDYSLSEESVPISGGLILRRGNVEINCSLERILDSLRAEMSAKVANILFR